MDICCVQESRFSTISTTTTNSKITTSTTTTTTTTKDQRPKTLFCSAFFYPRGKKLENTFLFKPSKKPDVVKMEKALKDFLDKHVDKKVSCSNIPDPNNINNNNNNINFNKINIISNNNAAQWAKTLSEEMRSCLKAFNCPRYKLICFVLVGQNIGQGIRLTSRCLLDGEADVYVSETTLINDIIVSAVAYSMYCE